MVRGEGDACARSVVGQTGRERWHNGHSLLVTRLRRGVTVIQQTFPRPPTNQLLAALLARRHPLPFARVQLVELRKRAVLSGAGDILQHVYFPTHGLIAVLAELAGGEMVEVATVGTEGMTGLPLFFASTSSADRVAVLIAGSAYRVAAGDFLRALAQDPALVTIVRGYARAYVSNLTRAVACHGAHDLSRRLASLLLRCHDSVDGGGFNVTQEVLSEMLGSQRPSVSVAAENLGHHDVIGYHRGRVRIIDRTALEAASCECYGAERAGRVTTTA